MNEILLRYAPRVEFEDYDDFYKNYRCNVPDDFNFAYDVLTNGQNYSLKNSPCFGLTIPKL